MDEAMEKDDICEAGVPWRSCDVGEVDMIVVCSLKERASYGRVVAVFVQW